MGKIIKKRIEYGGSSNSAENIKYDDAKNVKEAIDEVNSEIAEVKSNLNEIGDYEFVAKPTSNGSIVVPNLSNYRFIAFGYGYADNIIINLSTIPIGLFKTGKYFYVSAKYANVYDAQAHIKYVDDTTIDVGLYGSSCFIYLVN